MLMSNFGSITGMQDQQTLLPGSASKISFSFLSLNCFRARNAVQDLSTQDLRTFCPLKLKMITGGGVGWWKFCCQIWGESCDEARSRRLLGSLLPPLLRPRAYMSFEGSPFHSESVIVQAGHPQEREWHWLMFFQYHNAVVLYKQISGTSPSSGNCKIDWNLAVSLSINRLILWCEACPI